MHAIRQPVPRTEPFSNIKSSKVLWHGGNAAKHSKSKITITFSRACVYVCESVKSERLICTPAAAA